MAGPEYVFAGTPRVPELERLRAVEAVFDPATRRCLLDAGLSSGWKCLEVGAGAGSAAEWLLRMVGPAGAVTALDLDTRFLAQAAAAGCLVREADIRTAELEPESFDLAHARFVLIHLPDPAEALRAMLRALRRGSGIGGRLVLEEPDFAVSRALAGPPELRESFERVHRAVEAMFRGMGLDFAFGARLPELLRELGCEEPAVETEAPEAAGGSLLARMMALSTRQLRDRYLATGCADREDLDRYDRFAADPACRAVYHAVVRVSARKPDAGGGRRSSSDGKGPEPGSLR